MKLTLQQTDRTNMGNKEVYRSDDGRYVVNKIVGFTKDHSRRKVAWLIITPQGDTPLHDWRDIQEIKNLMCGAEAFAVEIYPPESVLVDANNNFHLWVYLDGYRLPLGFTERVVADPLLNGDIITTATPQRPFDSSPRGATNSLEAIDRIVTSVPPLLTVEEGESLNRKEREKEKRRKKK